ncbi:hypothetical protein C0995_002608 [Termitomyces sp. Mi166|nr:hypothetical protein C0995_002608 [Termitomyces sp. Mi166\
MTPPLQLKLVERIATRIANKKREDFINFLGPRQEDYLQNTWVLKNNYNCPNEPGSPPSSSPNSDIPKADNKSSKPPQQYPPGQSMRDGLKGQMLQGALPPVRDALMEDDCTSQVL